MVHPLQPADDLAVFTSLQLAELQPGTAQRLGCCTTGRILRRLKVLHGQIRLHTPHRQGQQGRAIRSLGKALDNPEGGRAELGQRRQRRRPDGQRETGGIAQRPAAGIVQVIGHHQRIGVGSQAISYTTGVPAMIGTKLVMNGTWKQPGVYNLEELDPDPFMEALNEYGLPWVVVENPQMVD